MQGQKGTTLKGRTTAGFEAVGVALVPAHVIPGRKAEMNSATTSICGALGHHSSTS